MKNLFCTILFIGVLSVNAQTVNVGQPQASGIYYNLSVDLVAGSTALNNWEVEIEQSNGTVDAVIYAQVAGGYYASGLNLVKTGNKIIVNNTGMNAATQIPANGTVTINFQIQFTTPNNNADAPIVDWNYFPDASSTNGGNNQAGDVSGFWESAVASTVSLKPTYDKLVINGFTTIKASETLGNDALNLYYPYLLPNGRNHYMYFSNRFFTGAPSEMYSAIGAYDALPNSDGNPQSEGPKPLILQGQYLTSNLGVGFHGTPPTSKLSVMGDFYTQANAGIGTVPNSSIQLAVSSSNKGVGLCVVQNSSVNYNYGVQTKVANVLTKGYSLYNTVLDKEVFVVMGDGEMQVRGSSGISNFIVKPSGITGIGADPHSEVKLRVNGGEKVGLCIEHNYPQDWGYGLKTIVGRNNTKALAVVNSTNNLDVFRVMGDGTIYATAVHVKLATNFPDYVFLKDYKLMSIDSLASYIRDNGHLPNTPTATEVERDGIDIGELARIQQEKIEELTLYLIEMKAQMDALKSEIEALKQ